MRGKLNENTTLSDAIEADEEAPMIEATAEVPEVYCDGIAAIEVHGENVRVTYYKRRRINGVEVRVPALEMVRPLRTCGQGHMVRLVQRAKAASSRH